MMHQTTSYLKFLKRSTNQHGVHSPFVYDLVTKCFYDKTKFSEYALLKDYRNKLLSSREIIEVKDLGAGSRVFKSDKRKIAAIAKNAGISSKRQRLLFRLANYFKPENSLELGTSLGLATAAMALGNTSAKVTTIEGCPATAKVAEAHFSLLKLKNIQLKNKIFEDFFLEEHTKKYDLVYIDGNHNKEKTLQYFEELLKHTTKDSVLIFDDIYWSATMTEAWEEIKEHPKVTVTIDSFFWGIVCLRHEQQKEHFTIRM
jgi:predicted O-methyltransferase YrrM